MCMRNFQTNNSLSYFTTRESTLNGFSHMFSKYLHRSQFFVRQIKDIIYLTFGNNQRMSFNQRVNIKKRIKTFILSHFVARNLTCNDFTEYCCHIV